MAAVSLAARRTGVTPGRDGSIRAPRPGGCGDGACCAAGLHRAGLRRPDPRAMDARGGRRRQHRSCVSNRGHRNGRFLPPVRQEDRRLLLRCRVRVHLVNPSDLSFGTAVITPRWLYVLAAATPARFGTPLIVDETLEPFDPASVDAGRRRRHRHSHGERAARVCRRRGSRGRAGRFVVFGGIHATLFPDEVREHGRRTASSAATAIWSGRGCSTTAKPGRRQPRTRAAASRARRSRPRDGICCPSDRYMWGSVQTVRGCPKHCSFCSVWRTDGQKPRQRHVAERRARGRRAAAQGIPLHPARRRQLLSGDAGRSRGGRAARRQGAARANSTRASAGAVRADGAARAAAGRHGVLHADHDGGGRGSRVPRGDAAGADPRRARRRRIGHARRPEGGLQELQRRRRGARHAAAGVPRHTACTCSGRSSSGCRPTRRHVRGDGGSGAAQRRVVRPVRDAHAVPGHGGFREVGAAGRESTTTIDGIPLDAVLADSVLAAPEGVQPAPDDVARGDPAGDTTAPGTVSTRCRRSGSARPACDRFARGWRSC